VSCNTTLDDFPNTISAQRKTPEQARIDGLKAAKERAAIALQAERQKSLNAANLAIYKQPIVQQLALHITLMIIKSNLRFKQILWFHLTKDFHMCP